MTENLKKFLEEVSKDRNLIARMKNAETADLLAMAKELNLELTEEDFNDSGKATVSDDELAAVAGGGMCACGLTGAGYDDGLDCTCTIGGEGEADSRTSYCTGHGNAFCICAGPGGGATDGRECYGSWR